MRDSGSWTSLRRVVLRGLAVLAIVAPSIVVASPASAFTSAPPIPPTIPASLARSALTALEIGGATLTSEGSLTAGGNALRFGAGAAGGAAGTALAAGAASAYIGYNVGLWIYDGRLPWTGDPVTYSGVDIAAGVSPNAWCFYEFGTSVPTDFGRCATTPLISVRYGSSPTTPYFYASVADPWKVANPGLSYSLSPNKNRYVGEFWFWCGPKGRIGWASNRAGGINSNVGTGVLMSVGPIGQRPHFTACGGGWTGGDNVDIDNDFGWAIIDPNSVGYQWWNVGSDLDRHASLATLQAINPNLKYYGFGGAWPVTPGEGNVLDYPTIYRSGTVTDPADPVEEPVYSGDLTYTLRLETQCKGAALNVWESEPFSDYDSRPEFERRVCPDGVLLVSQVFKVVPSAGDVIILGSYTAPPEFLSVPNTISDPDLRDCLRGQVCELRLFRQWEDGRLTDCFDGGPLCAGWWSDPAAVEKFACYWGGARLALSECEVFRNSFEAEETATPVLTEPSPGPGGVPSTDLTADPAPQPGTDPWSSSTPGLGDGCIPSGWEILNPFSLAKSVACVLRWAFVPNQASAQFTTLRTELTTRPPGSVMAAVTTAATGFVSGFTSGATCFSLPDFDPDQQGRLQLPCEPPGGAAYVFAYQVAAALIIGVAIWRIWAIVISAFGSRDEG